CRLPGGPPESLASRETHVSGKPAGEYPPPSTHRLFSFWASEGEQQPCGSERRNFFRPSAFQSPPQYPSRLKRSTQAGGALLQVNFHRLAGRGCSSGHRPGPDCREQAGAGERIDKRECIAGQVLIFFHQLERLPVFQRSCGKPFRDPPKRAEPLG